MYFKLEDKTFFRKTKTGIFVTSILNFPSGRRKMPFAGSLKTEKEMKSNKKENVSKTK